MNFARALIGVFAHNGDDALDTPHMPDASAWLLSGSLGLTLFALVAGLGGLGFILRRLGVKPPSIMLVIIAGLLAMTVFYWTRQPAVAFTAIGVGFALSLGLVLVDIARVKQP